MLEAFATRRNRTRALILMAVCCVFSVAALVVGVSDNPPGIALAFGAAIALVLAFVHSWRHTKQYALFLGASLVAFVVFGVLHNVFEGVAGELETVPVVQVPLQVLAVVTFLLAVLVCPPAVLVGAVGSLVMLIRRRSRPTRGQETGS